MPWYKFRLKTKTGIRDNDAVYWTYRYYDRKPADDKADGDCEDWTVDNPVSDDTGVEWDTREVAHPPLEWLQRKLEGACALRDQLNSDIAIYEAEIDRIQHAPSASGPR
jgi:hypothetical protein